MICVYWNPRHCKGCSDGGRHVILLRSIDTQFASDSPCGICIHVEMSGGRQSSSSSLRLVGPDPTTYNDPMLNIFTRTEVNRQHDGTQLFSEAKDGEGKDAIDA
jgi:hypothetical protein